MAIYEVYLQPGSGQSDSQAMPEFVADRASILVLIFPFFWLIWHRLWFWLSVYVLAVMFLNGLYGTQFAVLGIVFAIVPGFLIWLEGPNMLASKLEFHGWKLMDVIEADNKRSAQIRWLVNRSAQNHDHDEQKAHQPAITKTQPQIPQARDDLKSFGMFAED